MVKPLQFFEANRSKLGGLTIAFRDFQVEFSPLESSIPKLVKLNS